jgi:hypothetical protein
MMVMTMHQLSFAVDTPNRALRKICGAYVEATGDRKQVHKE